MQAPQSIKATHWADLQVHHWISHVSVQYQAGFIHTISSQAVTGTNLERTPHGDSHHSYGIEDS